MTTPFLVVPVFRQFDNAGAPLAGGLVYCYQAGSTTVLKATYSDALGTITNANPVVLDSTGSAIIRLGPGAYHFVVTDLTGTTTMWDADYYQAPYLTADDIGRLLYPISAGETANSITPTTYAYPVGDIRRYGALLDGSTDDTVAWNAAISAVTAARGTVYFPNGTSKVTAQITFATGVRLSGMGFSEKYGVGAAYRGASCVLRAFGTALPTLLFSGDDCSIDGVDVDNNAQGTGACVQVIGSRFNVGTLSTRNSGGDGFWIGADDSATGGNHASRYNANAFNVKTVLTCGNAAAGFRIDDTNTSTTTSYPKGTANANAGHVSLVDARNNGTDGLQLGNCNDNVFDMVVSQNNTGCGIRFKTDGTNAGPRCNKILGNDCESNTGNDIQIDAATLPAAAPGLYNVVLGNRSVAVASKIVDNSSGSLVLQWNSGLGYRGYHYGPDLNSANQTGATGTATFATTVMTVTAATAGTFAVGQNIIAEGVAQGTIISSLGTGTGGTGTYNLSSTPGSLGSRGVSAGGQAGVNMHAGPNLALARWYSIPIGAADSALRGQVHKSGGSYTDCLELNENGVFRTWYDLATLTYSASVTIDTTKGRKFSLSVTDSSALTINAPTNVRTGEDFTLIVRNTSGGAMGVITWNAVFKMSAWTNPANANSRSIRFMYDGTNWVQISGTGVDVPN